MPKKTTIEDLAAMIKHGFDATATKEDFHALKDDLHVLDQKVDAGFQHVNARLDSIRNDMSDPPTMREELHDLRQRLDRVEQKVGLVK